MRRIHAELRDVHNIRCGRNAWLASCESLASKASAAGALKGSRTETRDVRPLQTSYKGRFEQSGPISCGWPI